VSLLADALDFLNAIKKAAKEAVEASQPTDFCFGKVTSISPLNIMIEQKLILTPAQLVLTRNVTDFKTKVTIDWNTENKSGGSGESAFESHNHSIVGTKEITVHNSLAVGDKVVLLQKKGGQKYLVIDRLVKA
jgi:hypothetical protein